MVCHAPGGTVSGNAVTGGNRFVRFAARATLFVVAGDARRWHGVTGHSAVKLVAWASADVFAHTPTAAPAR
jgi:hypothetical protein